MSAPHTDAAMIATVIVGYVRFSVGEDASMSRGLVNQKIERAENPVEGISLGVCMLTTADIVYQEQKWQPGVSFAHFYICAVAEDKC